MSLFKVRDIWSLDLEELQRHSGDAPSPPGNIECRAQFIAHIGRFSCIGGQDVFVCGDLRGRIYLIQVPDSDQRKHIKSAPRDRPTTSASASSNDNSTSDPTVGQRETLAGGLSAFSIGERQILAAYDLGTPVVDLKCGFFTSALQQSIAVLTHEKLVILQVKLHQVDLLSAPNIGDSTNREAAAAAGQCLDKNLLSHELEVNIRLDLLPGQFAYNLLVLNSHADSSLVDCDNTSRARNGLVETNLDGEASKLATQTTDKFKRTGTQIVQQLHLPQRDKIIVQYTDQFVFTLIDSKKIVGHFCVGPSPRSGAASDSKLKQTERALGCMPAAYLVSGRACSLAVTFSDFSVRSLPLDKLTSQAKQNVMKRVALNLLGAKVELSAASEPTLDTLIQVDLEACAEWSHELLGLPLAMQGLRRQSTNGRKDPTTSAGQLLVMSRYSLDLFSSTGAHLWSQRFESPLICMHAYTTPGRPRGNEPEEDTAKNSRQSATVARGEKTNQQYGDKIITLLCTDNLSSDKCNLIITDDDRVSWSALLDSKPLEIWRLNLSHMPGLLATLDLMSGQLVVSYLGTNLDSMDRVALETLEDEASSEDADNRLVQLERLDETLTCGGGQNASQRTAEDDLRARLRVHNSLEVTGASDNSVQVCTSIQLDPSATGVVLHNITITFEYDDLLRFASDGARTVSHPAPGCAQICLGSCWPDRREPIRLKTTFSSRSSSLPAGSNTQAFRVGRGFDNLNDEEIPGTLQSDDERLRQIDARLLPKSLKVNQLLDFNETHSGLLHQREAFLLPISVIARLTHIDYSSGQGQELDDVLGNLNQYRRADGTTPALYCDLFLNLKCDLMTLLGEIIDGDLMCREQFAPRTTIEAGEEGEKQMARRRAETLDNINLLAQSLNCRLRLMSPTPADIPRQNSEELAQPVMVSAALRLNANNLNRPSGADQQTDQQIVWIHICDFTQANRSKIVDDFVDGHATGWMRYQTTSSGGGTSESGQKSSRALISIECDQALPVVLVLDHLIERARHLCWTDARLDTKVISARHSIDPTTHGNCLAVSLGLHDSLATLVRTHNSELKDKYKQLQSDLVKEYCKFQVVTNTSLSLAKRLPSLPDEMSGQVTSMAKLVKQYHQNLLSVLGELERLKRIDYEYSKLPYVSVLEIESPNLPNGDPWSGFDTIID